MSARLRAFRAQEPRRRPAARVIAAKLDLEARRRAELALFAATAAFACLASLVALLFVS